MYIGSIRSPDDRQGHAVCLIKSTDKPQHSFYFRFKESGAFNGTYIGAGYYILIDYDSVGSLTNAVGSNWKLKRVYIPEKIYGTTMWHRGGSTCLYYRFRPSFEFLLGAVNVYRLLSIKPELRSSI